MFLRFGLAIVIPFFMKTTSSIVCQKVDGRMKFHQLYKDFPTQSEKKVFTIRATEITLTLMIPVLMKPV